MHRVEETSEERKPRFEIEVHFSMWFTLASYVCISALSMFAVVRLINHPTLTPSTLPTGVLTWQIFVLVIATMLLIGLIVRLVNIRLFFEVLLGATLFLGVWVYCWFIIPWEIGLLIAALFTIVQARVRKVIVHNAFIVLGAAGIVLHFTFMFPLKTLVMILLGFTLYDLLAGRPIGISTKLAGLFIHRGIVPGLIIPGSGKELFARINDVVRSPQSIFLGSGDLILPVILVTRATLESIPRGIAVALGLCAGSVWLSQRGSVKPMPALVPLMIGAAIPFFITTYFHLL